VFLDQMETVVPWKEWTALITPYYPKGEHGRPPKGIELMLRMYLLQGWFSLSDEMLEDALYDSQSMPRFVGINLLEEDVPDATTLLKFRHLLEQHDLTSRMFHQLNETLSRKGYGQHDKAHLPLECAALVLQKAREDRDESACELGGGRHIDPSSVLNWGRHMTGQFDDLYLQAATSKLLRKAVGPRALFFEKALPPLVGDWWRQMAPKSLSSGGGAVWNNVTSALLLHWRGFPREEVRIL